MAKYRRPLLVAESFAFAAQHGRDRFATLCEQAISSKWWVDRVNSKHEIVLAEEIVTEAKKGTPQFGGDVPTEAVRSLLQIGVLDERLPQFLQLWPITRERARKGH